MKAHSFPYPNEQSEIDEIEDEPGVWEATAAFMISTPMRSDHAPFVALIRADRAQCGAFGVGVAIPADVQDRLDEAEPDRLADAATLYGETLEWPLLANLADASQPMMPEQATVRTAAPLEQSADQSAEESAFARASGLVQPKAPEVRRPAAAELAEGHDAARAPSICATFGLADADPQARLERLRGALRRERARGRCGHWTYDLARHLALAQDVRRAEAALRSMLLAVIPTPAAI